MPSSLHINYGTDDCLRWTKQRRGERSDIKATYPVLTDQAARAAYDRTLATDP